MNCPLCGALVTYVGALSIECLGAPRKAETRSTAAYPGYEELDAQPACPNYRALVAQPVPSVEYPREMWF